MRSGNSLVPLGILVLLHSFAVIKDKFSNFVGFIMSRLSWVVWPFLDSPFSLLASFCVLAGTGNSTTTLRCTTLNSYSGTN